MTRLDDATRVRHMRDAAKRAIEIAATVDPEDLTVNSLEALALVRLLEVLGEAAGATSAELRGRHPAIPWRQMVGTRNRVIHAYFSVDLDIVWQIVT